MGKKRKIAEYEDLIKKAVEDLTDEEKQALINALKNETSALQIKIENLKANAEASYAQARELEKQYQAMEEHYRAQLAYLDKQSTAFLEAIRMSTRGGIK